MAKTPAYPTLAGRPIPHERCRRGDVIAWAEKHSYAVTSGPPVEHTTYTIGIVTRVTRDGIVTKADDGFGSPRPVYHNIESKSVRGEQIDAEKAQAWLASDANYPRRGSSPLRSMAEVREVVRQWLKSDTSQEDHLG